MPKISVIIPVYNVEPYIRCCIDSVLAQSFKDFEAILVDDGSTDGSGAICEEYASRDSRIHVIHKKNGGQGSARNLGIELAQGQYIEFLDSDDWITPDTLEYLVKEAESKRLDLILFGGQSFIDGDESSFNTGILSYKRHHNFDTVMDGVTCCSKMEKYGECFTSICMRFFSAAYFQEHAFRFQEGIIHEDEDFGFLTVIMAKRAEIVDKQFYQRRYRPNSTMTGKTELESLHGYAGAFAGLAEAYQRTNPTGEMKKLYLNRMEMYLRIVTSAYQSADWKKKKEIGLQTQAFLRKGLRYQVPLSPQKKFAEYSLFWHDVCWGVYNSGKKCLRLLRK